MKLAAHLKNCRIVAGTHALEEAVKVHSKQLVELWLIDDWERRGSLRDWIKKSNFKGQRPIIKNKAGLDSITTSHQGAVGFFKSLEIPEFEETVESKDSCIVLVLDGIEDPHNLGAVIRTAWLMGVSAIVSTAHQSVGLTPTVHKVACGGVEYVPTYFVSNLGPVIEYLKKQDFWVYGLSHKAREGLYSVKLPSKVCWCIGAEEKGLRSTTMKQCDSLISIPQIDTAASYNASVATGMVVSETYRQLHAE